MSERSYLEEISIRNLGIIEQSELELGRGLNVLTGETGAGKTMILTALNLVLGGKSDSSLVRHGSERLVATAQFSVTKDSKDQLDEIGAEVDGSSLIVTRTVNSDGKSKASCGGVTVPAGTLADVTEPLIEIHGQSANSQIVKPARQRELLDRFGGTAVASSLSDYQEKYSEYLELKERIKAMKASANKRDGEIAELEEFLAAWVKLKAVRNEPSSVEDEIKRLSSVEDLRIASSGAMSALDSEESGALTLLHSARRFLDAAKGKDSKLEEIAERVAESLFILDDASSDLASYATSLEADPERLDFLQNRKAELNLFIKRWGGAESADEELVLLAAKAKSGKESIADLKGGDERIAELETELAKIKKSLLAAAQELSKARSASAESLSQSVTSEIQALSMPHTRFFAEVISPDYSGALKESDFTQLGCDEVSMQIQGQVDGPKIALGKGASGGEMSRIMLGLEVVIAKSHPVGTYIFDEVDAGVGGKAAIEVGKRLHALAQNSQVIVVTHLPQVAAWADTHFVVKKSSDGSVVQSGVSKLGQSERVEEIARMLAGLEESSSAREHAAELLAMRG
ncbi:DNA repair protein RecN (Recombination protein N) [Candidatus Planktophila sulfonica]|uniref:DNA repair protein RecN n=1 Tax=Candidatus Planktophila sulfonica TaxID=1884904 RepID=A0A249KGP0_9ACTN|nr:DNA repair protein RecN [Candidatus Planktophila sulfonica]ASY15916.1 DNA repair protein RecN (Recombination protein N) [Candidatus Planktophila sulfonica]